MPGTLPTISMIVIISPVLQVRNWVSEKISNLPKFTGLVNSIEVLQKQFFVTPRHQLPETQRAWQVAGMGTQYFRPPRVADGPSVCIRFSAATHKPTAV